MIGRAGMFLGIVCCLGQLAGEVRAQALVADLSKHLVAVTTGFVGTDLLLFGATNGEGDVVVVVRGPEQRDIVRRKERVAGIWVNRQQFPFTEIPAFYSVASSRPLQEIADSPLLARHQIGLEYLQFNPGEVAPEAVTTAFRDALIRNKQRLGVFHDRLGKVRFVAPRLFRTDVHLPSNVPTGTYTVTVYLIRDGEVRSAQTTPLVVSKIGIGARVFEFAHQHAAIYGVLAILMALFAGWLAGVIFRKP